MCVGCLENGPNSICGVDINWYQDKLKRKERFRLRLCPEIQASLMLSLYKHGQTPGNDLRQSHDLSQKLWEEAGLDFQYRSGLTRILRGKFIDKANMMLSELKSWGAFVKVDESRWTWDAGVVAQHFASKRSVQRWMDTMKTRALPGNSSTPMGSPIPSSSQPRDVDAAEYMLGEQTLANNMQSLNAALYRQRRHPLHSNGSGTARQLFPRLPATPSPQVPRHRPTYPSDVVGSTPKTDFVLDPHKEKSFEDFLDMEMQMANLCITPVSQNDMPTTADMETDFVMEHMLALENQHGIIQSGPSGMHGEQNPPFPTFQDSQRQQPLSAQAGSVMTTIPGSTTDLKLSKTTAQKESGQLSFSFAAPGIGARPPQDLENQPSMNTWGFNASKMPTAGLESTAKQVSFNFSGIRPAAAWPDAVASSSATPTPTRHLNFSGTGTAASVVPQFSSVPDPVVGLDLFPKQEIGKPQSGTTRLRKLEPQSPSSQPNRRRKQSNESAIPDPLVIEKAHAFLPIYNYDRRVTISEDFAKWLATPKPGLGNPFYKSTVPRDRLLVWKEQAGKILSIVDEELQRCDEN